ncbi:MAG TPA: hypothetical protein VFJ50_10625 [Gemmatimonadales bacterium]|nr:hypothetical protein [Gemmatimonadales bacterium]
MTSDRTRLAGGALVAGGALAIIGYVVSLLVAGDGDAHFTHPQWPSLYAIALAGSIITVLGLPAILAAQGGRSPRLTLVGYVGLFAALVMLNIGEGVIEGFIKPYFVTHGGIPDPEPSGFATFEGVGLLGVIVGLPCLGAAILRAKVLPRWVGVLTIASAPLSFVSSGLPGPLALLGDYFAYVALMAIGWHVARGPVGAAARVPALA